MTPNPVIYAVFTRPYISGVVSTMTARRYDCIYAALADAYRFARGERGSVDIDVNGLVVWEWHGTRLTP